MIGLRSNHREEDNRRTDEWRGSRILIVLGPQERTTAITEIVRDHLLVHIQGGVIQIAAWRVLDGIGDDCIGLTQAMTAQIPNPQDLIVIRLVYLSTGREARKVDSSSRQGSSAGKYAPSAIQANRNQAGSSG